MSGPITLFDKSFLQSLTVDEAVLFDNFFLSIICPLFYVETLADLEKSVREGRTPEQEVRIIAQKTPQMHSYPCAHHHQMCWVNLMGKDVPMNARIPVVGGRPVKVGDQRGVVFEEVPEAEAFHRWQAEEFLEVERRFAKTWRCNLNSIDLRTVAAGRALTAGPAIEKNQGGYLIKCQVAPSFPRIAAEQLGSQWAISPITNDMFVENGQIARVSGLASLPQKIRSCLSLQKGESFFDPNSGVRFAEYSAAFHDSPWFSRLLVIEVVRQSAIPHYTPLRSVKTRLCNVLSAFGTWRC